MDWMEAMPEADLAPGDKRLVRLDGRPVLIVRTPGGVRACANRCPHEGYPLAEGDVLADGTLRCNWHHWTFDLDSGETLVGGDRLRQYPVKVEDGRVYVRPERPDPAVVRRAALDGIARALGDSDQPRLLRETARLELAGGDGREAIVTALAWLAPRLRYGTTHAIAGAADWLALATGTAVTPDRRLAALGEILGHIARDGRRESRYAYETATLAWDRVAFLAAVEASDESAAIATLRGALASGETFAELTPVLAEAALSHYAGFGHSLIYVVKSAELAAALGESATEALLFPLVRSLCTASREDLLPQFRGYAAALAAARAVAPAVDTAGLALPPLSPIARASVTTAFATVVAWSARYAPQAIFRALVDSAALALLHADEAAMLTTSGPIASDVGWLDHTHAVTFAEAGERVARLTPALWPAVLLQIACFLGRNHAYVDVPPATMRPPRDGTAPDPFVSLADLRESLFDHGRDTYIVSVHLIKTLVAATNLIEAGRADAVVLAAAVGRFFHAPQKRRHVIRSARQMLALASDHV